MPHIQLSDGTIQSEQKLSYFHKIIRNIVFSGSSAFISASNGGSDLFKSYGINPEKIFKAPLAIDNSFFQQYKLPLAKKSDFLFSGRLVEKKNPLFCFYLAEIVGKRIGRKVSLSFLGDGPLMKDLQELKSDYVDVDIRGFIPTENLPKHFLSSRIFLFPTAFDPWGVVANEACASSLPVIVSPFAGAALDLVQHKKNGFVLPLDIELWAEAAIKLLQDNELYKKFAKSSYKKSLEYNHTDSANMIAKAVYSTIDYSVKKQQKVVIVQRRLTSYRVPLFQAMRVFLKNYDVDLHLIQGDATNEELLRLDSGELIWSKSSPCKYFLSGRLVWQNYSEYIKDADLVIATQENKLIYNIFTLLLNRPARFAFWGHGENLQSGHKNSFISDLLKKFFTLQGDWVFAYTSFSVNLFEKIGYDSTKITNLNNASDTSELSKQIDSVDISTITTIRKELGLTDGLTAVFVGSLHKHKRIQFLLETAKIISARIPGFTLLIIGDGPDRGLVESFLNQNKYVKFLGAQVGYEKAKYLRVSNLMLNPGMVGLGILDAFVAGIPIITTDCKIHSPEISYFFHDENGLISSNTLSDYVDTVIKVFDNEDLLSRLSKGALESKKLYTIERMAERFSEGILRCLNEVKVKS